MELKVIYEHEEMRDMVVHVNSEGLQKIMAILADERNIIVTQLTKRAADICLRCNGTGVWNYYDNPVPCDDCNATGKRR